MTQTGENTIGCLVNGEPFTDSGLMNNFYQFVNGDSVLAINWEQEKNGINRNGRIALRNIEVIPNQDYILNKNTLIDGAVEGGFGTYTFSIDNVQGGNEFRTNNNFSGVINFLKLDTENQIMSGTFEFEAEEINTGEIITVSDGRFDLTFVN
ncbi:hypothetical protein ESY86_19500 [Subsaximicrobium wynnwilliamsii]|uniref:Uncharacterized protein n=1 Tax=Subsaximicrobium wynnwilliamsii TaxID=291179 RepID=A0A5C6ZCI6_9FLAO|nr:hypothetical protein ESY87_19525 [Subsaximicrobium wynnwilliamsii]TXD86732.1 hypothetical protein ESY86_19500 [Subsaximicrobium wynnwilliamsii]TXE00370.1 hypothetical protein ESY88_19530 [Subsaximicrobium wynnwilliamsii]